MSRTAFAPFLSLALAGVAVAGCTDLLHNTDFANDCASDPTLRGCDARPITTDDPAEALRRATRACGWLGACNGTLKGGMGTCFERALTALDARVAPTADLRGQVAEKWALLAAATSCSAVTRATGLAPTSVSCGASSVEYTGCAGDVRILCPAATVAGTPPVGAEPCALAGQTCTPSATADAQCTGVTGLTCSGPPRCDGTRMIVCEGGRDVGRDCALEGDGTCVTVAGTVGCLPRAGGTTCTPSDVACSPDGRFADVCSAGEAMRVDCSPLGLKCRPGAPKPGARPFDACTSGNETTDACVDGDRCEGGKLVACVHGASISIACSDIGLGACRSDGPGRAACALP